jgi:hypothetical protein
MRRYGSAAMSQMAGYPPGFYPDGSGQLQWWNGTFYTGQMWRPTTDEILYRVVIHQVRSKLFVRGTLQKNLGLARDHAKALVEQTPSDACVNVNARAAETLVEQVNQGNLAGWSRNAVLEVVPVGFASRLVTVPAPPPGTRDPRFGLVEAEYAKQRERLVEGDITREQLDGLLDALVFTSGGWDWTLGAERGQWFAWDGARWVPSTPPGA